MNKRRYIQLNGFLFWVLPHCWGWAQEVCRSVFVASELAGAVCTGPAWEA
jgi:hypothetical protein